MLFLIEKLLKLLNTIPHQIEIQQKKENDNNSNNKREKFKVLPINENEVFL